MSALSALLIQDQVVSPDKLDEAIQRQVLSGGDLEASLLEVGALAEDTLGAYCAAAYDLPLATRDEVLEADPVAIARLPRDVARRHGVASLRIEGHALVLACSAPLDAATQSALADAVGLRVEARIATPFRVAWALWRYYQVDLSPRYVRLADRLHTVSPGDVPAVVTGAARASMSPGTRPSVLPDATRSALAALSRALEDDETDDPEGPGETIAASPPEASSGPPEPATTLAVARTRLTEAENRDAVVAAMMDHLAGRFAYVALLLPHADVAEGLAARGVGAHDNVLRALTLSLQTSSALRDARDHGETLVRSVASGSPDAAHAKKLLRPDAPYVLVSPLRIARRVALLVWADVGAAPPNDRMLRDLAAFLDECGGALTRLVRSRKRGLAVANPSAPPAAPSIPIVLPVRPKPLPASRPSRDQQLLALRQVILGAAAREPSQFPPRPPGATLPPMAERRPTASVVPREKSPSGAVTVAQGGVGDGALRASTVAAATPAEIDRWVSEVVQTGTLSDATAALLIAQGERALPAVFRYFPGPTTLDRTHVLPRLPALSETGPLLRLVLAFRQAALPRLLSVLDTGSPDARFAALLCLAEIVHPSALSKLSPRLLDPDYPTRMATLEVLRGYRRFPEFASVARALHAVLADPAETPDRRRIAAHALGELRDTDAIPALIAPLGDADFALAGSAHRALVVLARQDFGTDIPRWLAWWDKARTQNRIEWLIEALLHPEPTIRHDASEELKRLSGQFFGYYFNLPRRERERAHQRYIDWWKREGLTRQTDRR